MLAEWKQSRFRIEIALLLALCFFLPLLEAPKNLAWLAYAAAWLLNRIRARDFGGRWDAWDTLFALWIASGFVVAAAAQLGEIRGEEWKGALDLLRYGSVGWLVKRARYAERVQRWVLGALVASVLIGLAVGFVRLWTGIGKSGTLQLHSVGHVNHSAIYIAIMLGVLAAWLFAAYRRWTSPARLAGVACLVILFGSLLVTASRGAFGAGILVLVILAAAGWKRWRAPAVAIGIGTVAVVVLAVALRLEIVAKQERYEKANAQFSLRDGIWRTGLVAWERHPWFGLGIGNYSEVTLERVKAWRAEAGKSFEPSRYVIWSHGHSLFVNSLAERGVVGVAPLLALLLAWGVLLLRYRPRGDADDMEWAIWGASASGWTITVSAGLFNTTLHHEHGILAALLLGLWLGRLKARTAS